MYSRPIQKSDVKDVLYMKNISHTILLELTMQPTVFVVNWALDFKQENWFLLYIFNVFNITNLSNVQKKSDCIFVRVVFIIFCVKLQLWVSSFISFTDISELQKEKLLTDRPYTQSKNMAKKGTFLSLKSNLSFLLSIQLC